MQSLDEEVVVKLVLVGMFAKQCKRWLKV